MTGLAGLERPISMKFIWADNLFADADEWGRLAEKTNRVAWAIPKLGLSFRDSSLEVMANEGARVGELRLRDAGLLLTRVDLLHVRCDVAESTPTLLACLIHEATQVWHRQSPIHPISGAGPPLPSGGGGEPSA